MFCANIKPNQLDSKFALPKHVIIETKARDKFSIDNVDTGTTLGRHAKYLQHPPSKSIDDVSEVEISTNCKKSNNSSDFSAQVSDTCDNTEPSGHVDKQASQNERVIATKSGGVVKSTKDCDNFVYY